MTIQQNQPATTITTVTHRTVQANGLHIHIAEQGSGPLLLLCHGFPELWYSWRHQMNALSQAGYHVVAPDLRGYGQTDQPEEVSAYTQLHLVGDLVGLLEALGEKQAVLVGHDWGSALVWNAALIRPDLFPAIITMSVPYSPRRSLTGARATIAPSQAWQNAWGNQFFYQLDFLEVGKAEAAFERDINTSMRRFFYGLSGDASPAERWHPILPEPQVDPLNTAGNPAVLPSWLTEEDLTVFINEFKRTGLRGGLNWYRNIDRNWELLAAHSGATITQPTLFLWGDQDPVLEVAGMSKEVERMHQYVPNLQQKVIAGAGHWVQQERPSEVNDAMIAFLSTLR